MTDDLAGLVRSAQRGDPVAMNDLLDRLAPYVGRIAGPIALSSGPDAAQEALTAIFRALPALREPAAVFGWARAITVREAVRVVRRDGDRVGALARSRYGMRARLDGVLRPGWCWLQSRFLLIGMAAAAEPGGGTRVALTGGVRIPGRAALVPIGVRREAERALDRLERLV